MFCSDVVSLKRWKLVWKPFLCLYFICVGTAYAEQLVISTSIWTSGYTVESFNDQSEEGLYEELLRTVYQDYQLTFIYTDYQRSKALVKNGIADLWLSSYMNEERFAIYPSQPMDKDFLFALSYKPVMVPNFNSLTETFAAAWMVGYQIDKYFPDVPMEGLELNDITIALKLLKSEKISVFIGDDSAIKTEAKRVGASLDDFRFTPFGELPVYPAFKKSPRTATLITIWDRKMVQLRKQGKLKALFTKHNLLEDYPFEN